jgi:DNA-binding FadR family transcriptional regulator
MSKAYEDVATMLLEQILQGERVSGDRLPSEIELANHFGVSRATVREALRLLTARGLIRTAKGMRGGSYVQVPSVEHIADTLRSSLNILTAAAYVPVEELLEARELLEIPAARLAATRRTDQDIARMKETIRLPGSAVETEIEFAYNADFHKLILDAAGNTLLLIAAQPVFAVLRDGFQRSSLGAGFHEAVREHHHEIARAIERGEQESAGELMHQHLEYLRPTYEDLSRAGEDVPVVVEV